MHNKILSKYWEKNSWLKYFVVSFLCIGLTCNCYASDKDIERCEKKYNTIKYLISNNKELNCSDGSFWVGLKDKTKHAYLNGFLDGVISNQYRCQALEKRETTFKDVDLKTFTSKDNLLETIKFIDEKYSSNKDPYISIHETLMMIDFIPRIEKQAKKLAKSELIERINDDPELDAAFKKLMKDMEKNKIENEKKYKEMRIERKKYAEKFSMETGIEKVDPSDGYYWGDLSLEEKCGYIIGIIDSVSVSDMICLGHSQDYKNRYLMFFYHIKKINDMADALDNVYNDIAYRKLTTHLVLMVENVRASGMITRETAKKTYDLAIQKNTAQ